MGRKFDVRGKTVEAELVEVPAGRAAFDLETGRTVRGPGKVWQVPKESKEQASAMITEVERRLLTGEAEESDEQPKKRGRPPGSAKMKEGPPDL